MNDELTTRVSAMLAPWAKQLGEDRVPYTNHIVRVLLLCEELSPGALDRTEFIAAGVFHDLGIWSDDTFDYLDPSIDRAKDWLEAEGHSDLFELVARMIDQHHKLRAAGGPNDPVEVFRRADTIDVLMGARRFGVKFSAYRRIRKDYPDRGFHRRLVQLTAKRFTEQPTSPLPMYKW